MSDESRLDEAELSVLLDIRNPFSYLAIGPAAAFGKERGLGVNWLPIRVPALKAPSEPSPDDDRSVRHRRNRARMIAREIATYADAQGLVLRECYREGETTAFQIGWLFVRERIPDRLETFLSEAFRAYWAVELDPSRTDDVAAIVEGVGGDRAAFDDWVKSEGPALLDRIQAAVADHGIAGAPAYWVAGQCFLGRQHLPMIAWLLDGEEGPGPI